MSAPAEGGEGGESGGGAVPVTFEGGHEKADEPAPNLTSIAMANAANMPAAGRAALLAADAVVVAASAVDAEARGGRGGGRGGRGRR